MRYILESNEPNLVCLAFFAVGARVEKPALSHTTGAAHPPAPLHGAPAVVQCNYSCSM